MPDLCRRMAEEVRALVPDRRHFVATEENWPELRRELKPYRIGLAPVMLTREASALRRAAYRLAPHKILAYNSRLERHHLRLDLASLLFWRGVPLDRIYLRPWWWPWPKRERSVVPQGYRVLEGRAVLAGPAPRGRALAVLSVSAVAWRRGAHLQSAARDGEASSMSSCSPSPMRAVELAPVLEFCARVVLVEKPRYREPRWSTLLPPEVHEFRSPAMRQALAEERRAFGFEMLQVEYTQLAEYGGDILVEHDVTFDLFTQIARRERTLSARVGRLPLAPLRNPRRCGASARVVVMSEKDAEMLGVPSVVIRERRGPGALPRRSRKRPGERLLFIGSFRHFPNVAAYRFFTEEVWPLLRDKFPRHDPDGGLRRRPSHLLARLHRLARAAAGPAHPPARISSATCGRCMWRATWCWCRPRSPPAPT